MSSKIFDILKKVFPIGNAFTKSTGMFILGIIVHLAINSVGGLFAIIPVLGWIIFGAISLYMAASLLYMVVVFSKVLEAPASYEGEDDKAAAILRKVFPISFKYCNKGKSLAIGIILNVILMILTGSVISAISTLLTFTVVGILLTSFVNTVGILVNIYFVAAIVIQILVATDVIKAAKPLVAIKVEKTEEEAAK